MKLIFIFGLMFFAMLSRMIPHPPNFTALTAVALFAGVYLKEYKLAMLMPFMALLLSDFIIGFYPGAWSVYLSFALVFLVSYILTSQTTSFSKKWVRVLGTGVLGSIVFFIVSNFFVWLNSQMYTLNLSGFIDCYVAAIPFFKNQLLGDVFYSSIIFGAFEFGQKTYPKLAN